MTGKRPEERPEQVRGASPGERVLSHAQAGREVVQEFVPLADSLEWLLGGEYLRQRGNKAFLSDASPVPYIVNNSGDLSRNAAEVFFASLVAGEAREARGEGRGAETRAARGEGRGATDQSPIFVLEVGIGVGLFARYFLDAMRELCGKHKKDYYDRLIYIAADRSERMLHDVLRHGVLAEHPGRYRVQLLDAMHPEPVLRELGTTESQRSPRDAGGPFRAVFLNYLLDCLPAAMLEWDKDEVRQLYVRTCVGRNVNLADYTDLTPEQLRERAKSSDPRAKDELLEVYGLFASEYDYRAVEPATLPYGAAVLELCRPLTKRVLHSYGAIQCLEKLLPMLADGGFILVNDYGQTQISREDDFEHQRFSLATFVGVNFALLRKYFTEGLKTGQAPQGMGPVPFSNPCQFIEPNGEEGRGIHARLVARRIDTDVASRFQVVFGDDAHKRLQEPIQKARTCGKAGRFELAAGFYREAMALQPRNWVLLLEVSQFLTFQMRDPKAGADMAKVALGLNPTCSAELWNALGDAHFAFGQDAEARSAYEKALSVNAADVRARYNLAWVHCRQKEYPAALGRIAEALALDKTGEYRERLLQKQQEVLARQTQRHQQEYLLLINLVSKHAEAKKSTTKKPEEQELEH